MTTSRRSDISVRRGVPYQVAEVRQEDGVDWSACNKINSNFKAVVRALNMMEMGSSEEIQDAETRQKGSVAQLRNYVDNNFVRSEDFEDLERKLKQEADARQSADAALLAAINELRGTIGSFDISMFAPPVGSYLFSETDPSEKWPGTKWERQPDGHYLISAADGDDGTVGSNSYTLTASQMPQHSHTGPAHTHSMAHTHTGPSHTHAKGTLAAASGGAHTHTAASTSYSFMLQSGDYPSAGADGYSGNLSGSGYKTYRIPASQSYWAHKTTGSGGAHTHTISGNTASAGNGNTGGSSAANTGSAGTGSTGTAGGSSPVDNRPASIKAPLWKRIS